MNQIELIKKNLNNLNYYISVFFENIFLKYSKGLYFDFLKFSKKTEYRLKNNLLEFENLIKQISLPDILFILNENLKNLKNKKKEIYLFYDDFFLKSMFVFIYGLQISHICRLLNFFEKQENLNMKKIENILFFSLSNASFEYAEIAKQINPEIKAKKKPITIFLKKSVKKKNVKKKSYLLFIFLFIFFYVAFIFIKSILAIYEIFCMIFPHRTLTEEIFYEKYNKNLAELTWFEEVKIFCYEFYEFWYLELNWTKINVIGFAIAIGLIYNISNSKKADIIFKRFFAIDCSNENRLIRNLCLKENLIEYHRIIYSFFAIYDLEKTCTKEQWKKNKEKRLINIYNLYHIITKNSSKDLINIVMKHGKYLKLNLNKKNEEFLHFVYLVELKHCDLILDFLEKKKSNEEIEFHFFVDKMLSNFIPNLDGKK